MLKFLSTLIFFIGLYTYIGIERNRISFELWLISWLILPLASITLCILALKYGHLTSLALGSSVSSLTALTLHVAHHIQEYKRAKDNEDTSTKLA